MIKKNIKKYALFCLTAILVCTMGVLINMPLNNVKGGTVSFEITNVEDVNRLGTEITLANEVAVEYNGNTVNFSKGSITFPDGKTYNVGTYKLSQVGKYTVRYYYQDGNVIVTAEKTFDVTDNYYALTSASGSITAVTAEEQKAVHESEEVLNGTKLPLQSNADNILLSGKDGIILRLQDGCQFIYNTPIDLSKGGEDGIAEILSVNYRLGNLVPNDDPKYWEPFMFKSKTIPAVEDFNFDLLNDAYKFRYANTTASRCKIKLTDAYNPDIYVELDEQKAHLGDRGSSIFHQNYRVAVSAAASGQLLVGCRKGSSANKYGVVAEINGEQYIAYQNWNRATSNSSYLTSGKAHQENGTVWGFDNETNIVYTKDTGNWAVVNDLDHPVIYPDNAFPGFTTGEVYVSIYFTDYAGADDARVDILSIGETSGAELVNQYNKAGRVDFNAPEIFINYDETDAGVIYAPLGGEVELPSAFVKEVFSDGSYSVNVYTNYNTEYKKLVTTKNNKLKLVENTVYTVEYTAVDSSGQVGKATMNICPVATEKSIWVETTKLENVHAGDLVKLPEYVIKTINNANKVKYSIKVVGENETINVDLDTNAFRPQYTGKYKVIFEFEDNAYSGVYEYEIDITGDTAAKFLTKPVLPKYVVAGETYSFDMLKGYIFSATSVQEVSSEGYVSVDGGDFVKIPDINAYKITATDNIRVMFKNGDSESQISEAKVITNSIKVINSKGAEVDVVRLYKYFVGDYTVSDPFNDAGRPTAASITYSMNTTTDDQKLTFANIIDYDKFVFQFKPGMETNYESLNIVLTDVYDEDIKLVIKYYVKGSGFVINVNGKENYVDAAFASQDATYSIEYNKAKKQMIVNGLVYDFGFEKFNTNLCYFDIVMEKVNGPASITVEKVGNHVFRGTKQKDDVAPQIDVVTSDGTYEIGSTVTLNVPTFTDSISQINKSKNTVTIEHEDGTKFAIEDIYKPYELKLDKLGVWSIIYNTEDTVGNKAQYRYALTVADRSAPVIVVDDYAEDTMIVVKKGTLYNLKYTVSDNMTATEDLIVSVRMENLTTGEMIDPSSTNELPCTIVGDYAVYISAVDEYKNHSYTIVYIRVEEGGKK